MSTPQDGRGTLRRIAHGAMLARGLQPEFSRAALAQLDRITQVRRNDPGRIRDLRALPWSSIDNDDSRDLDQLCVAEPLADGAVKILVAIADVDALVARGCALDDDARANTTSVYTAGGIFPMLPEKLSTDLTSLNEGVERLAVVIEMAVGSDGTVTGSDVYRARVLNHARLAYNGVAAWLDGVAPAPPGLAAVRGLDEQVRIQESAARALRRLRYERGALRLESGGVRAIFDGAALANMVPDAKNRAKEMIEDFMIAANGVAASYLEGLGVASLRRVLRTPRNWPRIMELAAEAGETLPPAADAAALDRFLEGRRKADPQRFPDLSLSVVKLLGSGEYAVEMPGESVSGHFGLAVRDYTHSTAPNRRFPDLITQRLLKAALAGQPPAYTPEELVPLALHCTAQEDNAGKVERQVAKSAAALLLSSKIGAQFDGLVTGASAKGTWVRIAGPAAEGRVVRGFEGLRVGDRVRVQLAQTDVARGFIDFTAVPR